MDKEQVRAQAHILNPAVWVLDNELINENQQPFEFDDHRFMLQPYADSSPDQVIMKSAQVGWSVAAILKSVHAAALLKLNVIYILPTRNASGEFVVPKVNPMLQRNPSLAALVKSTDNKSLKQVGDRFIYFKGAFHRGEAVSTTADLVIADEFDISDQAVLTTYESRLQASKYAWFWRFSNPTIPGFGVHELFQESDQMTWFVTCPHCGYEWYMEFERGERSHHVDVEKGIYACGKCLKELPDDDRQSGRWIARYPNRTRRGYHISQLIVPWVPAKKIVQQSTKSPDFFNNFVLGLPYQASELLVNRDSILGCLSRDVGKRQDFVLGVDNGLIKHWVLGNREGILAYGKTEHWEDIERMIKTYNATTVIDALPDFTIPQQLVQKYRGKVHVHYYVHNAKDIDVSRTGDGMKQGVIQSDRTKIFDQVAAEFNSRNFAIYVGEHAMNDYIYHWENMYRIVEEDTRGIERGKWETKENRPDHWAHATVYYRVGVGKALGPDDSGAVRGPQPTKKEAITVDPVTNTVPAIDVLEMARKTNRKVKI